MIKWSKKRRSIRICLVLIGFVFNLLADDSIRRGLGPEPDSLDIHQAQGLTAINLLRELREGLITFNAEGELVPGVAASWQQQDGGRTYRFSLRKNAKWSNGDPITAHDFVRAWKRALNPETAAVTAGLMQDIIHSGEILRGEKPTSALGVKILENGDLEVSLAKVAPWFLEILAHPVSYPLHEAMNPVVQNDPVNGAYVLGEWIPRSVIHLQANPQYHSADRVRTQSISYFPIEEPATELARYRSGELDVTETIPTGRFEWLENNFSEDLRISPYLGSFWLGLNMQHSDLGRSPFLRQALALAVDRNTLVRVALGAGEQPAWSVVPPGMTSYTPPQMAFAGRSQQEREAEARRLYEQAGFGPDRPLLLELRYNTSGLHRRVAVTVAAMWKQVLGVNSELVNEEWKVFVNNRRLGRVTEVFRGGWIADFADPSSFLDLFVSGADLNNTFHSDDEFDRLMRKAGQMVGNERLLQMQKAESRLLENMPVIPLYYYVSRHLVRPEIMGFVDNIRDIHLSRYLSKE